jgi:hypothetical protein
VEAGCAAAIAPPLGDGALAGAVEAALQALAPRRGPGGPRRKAPRRAAK